MDITFDVENGMYALAAASDAMKFEIFINATCVILGVWTLLVSWRRLGRRSQRGGLTSSPPAALPPDAPR
jgi:hypothetical protein